MASILSNGLHSSARLVEGCKLPETQACSLIEAPRKKPVALRHPHFGPIELGDNSPINLKALAASLDDGLIPAQWLRLLNERVFFWSNARDLQRLLQSRLNRARERSVLIFDTHKLAEAYGAQMEISPINSGAANRRVARRGYATFAPLLETAYATWRRARKKRSPDRIVEIAVRASIAPIEPYLVSVEHFGAGTDGRPFS